jgi:putative phage-type endonuclease
MHERVKELIEQNYADQKSDAWLALRGTMLTASDVATALGDNPYEKPSSLVMKKCGLGEKFLGNDATRHGEKYEPVARDIYCAQTGEVAHEIGLVQHRVHKWLGGSPDGITENGILIEIKCPLKRKIENKVPKHYLAQLQILMEILDLEICDFIQYRPDPYEFVVTRVQRDRNWFTEKLPIMRAFWDEVLYKREHGLCELK